MSAWLTSLSLPNPFLSGSGSGSEEDDHKPSSTTSPKSPILSELSQTISHGLRGVASFFYSADDPTTSKLESETNSSDSDRFTGIKNDFVEIGGSVKALLSSSSNKAAAGISTFTSSLLKFADDDQGADYEEDEAVCDIDEEVVAFAQKIACRPELWLEFPLPLDDEFDMSDSQKVHAASIERLVPNLASLRQEICSYLSNGKFWLIYFVLLFPRLNKTGVELLASSKIVEVREKLLLKLQNISNAQLETSGSETAVASEVADEVNIKQGGENSWGQTDISPEAAISDPDVQEVRILETGVKVVGEEADQCKTSYSQKHSGKMEDVSFSDLEDDDNDLSDQLSGLRLSQSARISSASESNEWVRLNESSGAHASQLKGSSNLQGKDSESEDSTGWLTVDDAEIDSLAAP